MDKAQLEKRLASIESRLLRMEKDLKKSSDGLDKFLEPDQPIFAETEEPLVSHFKKPSNGYLLGLVAVICFVLAGGLLIKLSIDSGWLVPTPAKQIGMASLLGLGLIFSRFIFSKIDKNYANFLPCAGIIILYLTVFAAHRYHGLISFETALGLLCLVSALCMWLYVQISYEIFGIIAAIGTYVSPVSMHLNTSIDFTLYYYLACSFTFAWIAIWRNSRILMVVSAYFAIFMSGVIGQRIDNKTLLAIILLVNFLIFSGGTYLYSIRTRLALTTNEALAFLPVLLIFYGLEYRCIHLVSPGMAPWFSLGFVAILMALYAFARRHLTDISGSTHLILGFATIVLFHSGYLELLNNDSRAWLFPIIWLGFSLPYFTAGEQNRISKLYIPMVGVFLILAIEYITMVVHLLLDYSVGMDRMIVAFASLLSIWIFIVSAHKKAGASKYLFIVLAIAHWLAILALYRLTTDTGSLGVSASWLFYAVAVIMFANMRRDFVMAKSALFVLSLAAGKALIYDASSAPTIIRILCLLLTGGVLYGCGLFMRKTDSWKPLEDNTEKS